MNLNAEGVATTKTKQKTESQPLNRKNSMKRILAMLVVTLLASASPSETARDMSAFETASQGQWREVFADACMDDWKQRWFLDGEVGTVTNSPEGMTLTAGHEYKNDAHHIVLWTKESFSGDLKIDYDYTRLDQENRCVNILYVQATGSGLGPYAKDITTWNDLRRIPAMSTYFDHLNTYHLSYAAFPDGYIRGRRYMPEKDGLKGTELKPDYFPKDLFKTGVPHKITVIKKARDLFVRIENAEQTVFYHMSNTDLPEITEGRIGLRHMFIRAARYRNFRVSVPVEKKDNAASASQVTAKAVKRPNVVVVLTDDQGYSDVGFNGNPIVKTPVLDRFAAGAAVFEQFYAAPVCSPSRASLMTGRYPFRTGVLATQEGLSILRPTETTLAEALKTAGYRTGLFGKWHLGDNAPSRPMDQGFDRSLTFVGGMIGAPYNPMDGNAYFNPVLIDDGVEKRFDGYCADIFTDAAIRFVKSSSGSPFFVYLALNTPHHPLTVPETYAAPYRAAGLSEETSRFYGMISNIDDNFGKMLGALKEAGVADNTLIIFLSDNGTSSLHHQKDLWERGLRGRKTSVYEGGIRVPAAMKLPGTSGGEGLRLDTPANIIDVFPTVLAVCGLPLPSGVELDGRSLLPLLSGGKPPEQGRLLYVQFHGGTRPEAYRNMAVCNGQYKLVQPVGRGSEPCSPETMRFELYKLGSDPLERNDIAGLHPETVARLKAEYDTWFKEVCKNGFEPVRTWVGCGRQNPVMLTRQDWVGGGLFDGDLGTYLLDVKSGGTYRITCRWSDLLKETHPVTLKINGTVITKNMLYAESECRFDWVVLKEGPSQLEAWLEIDGQKKGFRFVEIEKCSKMN